MTPLHTGGFGTPTHEDGRPWLWFIAIVGCSYSVFSLSIRLLAKWDLLGIEDVLIASSYVFAAIYWGLFDRAVWDGMGGSDKSSGNLTEASKLFRSSWTVLLCSIYLGKISVLLFERRIFGSNGSKKRTTLLFNGAMVATAACGIAAICVSSIACDFGSTFRSSSHACSGLEARNITILVLEIVTEILIFVLPTYFVSKTKIGLSDRITVISMFSFRLVCIPFMAVATTSMNAFAYSSHTTPSRAILVAAIWTQVVLAWSISSASFPCIKSFLAAFVAVGDGMRHGTTTSGHHSGRNAGSRDPSKTTEEKHRSRVGNNSAVQTGQFVAERDDVSLDSDASQRIMIARRVDVDVVTESADRSMVAELRPGESENYSWARHNS